VLLGFLVYGQRPRDESAYLGNNLLFFLLVNLLIVILCVLVFLVGRNVVKLIFDRRRNILGSKLRLRLVAAFVGLTLIPTSLLFVLASDLLSQAMEGWFSTQVEASVESAVELARNHYAAVRTLAERSSRRAATDLAEPGRLGVDRPAFLEALERTRQEYDLFAARFYPRADAPPHEAMNAAATLEPFSEPAIDRAALGRAFAGEMGVTSDEKSASQFVRVYLPVSSPGFHGVLVTSTRIQPEISHALGIVTDSFNEYEQLKFFKQPLRLGYLLTLAMITLLILFSAIWIAFYLARELVVPIQRLAEGTEAVARGNYDFQIRTSGDDEIGSLVRSFNRMTTDLKNSRRDAERRRLFIETILSNLAVGVVGLDTNRIVTSANAAAARIYELSEDTMIGRSIDAVLKPVDLEPIEILLGAIAGEEAIPQLTSDVAECELNIVSQGRELKIICTAGKIIDLSGRWSGTVLLFDDITDLSKAQHMSAWREVAQRIAHEIKNPLTPIQLSAQRLARLLAGSDIAPAVRESTQAIVENVDSIKRLANEFSHFARMPTAEFKIADVNHLIADTLAPYAENHSEIVFQFIPDTRVPDIVMDPEQVRRCLMNLIDNAIAACTGSPPSDTGARILVRTDYDKRRRMVVLEVSDNGPGIPPGDKSRIFEPYFTTKDAGTGLGLAIVTSIVADHQGYIRCYDNHPRGTKFIIELPVSPRAATQRRFSGETTSGTLKRTSSQ
jgi:two-component system nitrogen regulation sensor histidine kinase NtrY